MEIPPDQKEQRLQLTIAELLRRWPQLVPIFVRFRTDCVGCGMAPFCSLQEAIDHYQLNASSFLRELQNAMVSSSSPSATRPNGNGMADAGP